MVSRRRDTILPYNRRAQAYFQRVRIVSRWKRRTAR